MNEKLKGLAEQAGFGYADINLGDLPRLLERFAELVRADEREMLLKMVKEEKSARPGAYVRQLERLEAAIRGRTE